MTISKWIWNKSVGTNTWNKSRIYLEQGRIAWPQGSHLAIVIQGFEYGETGLGYRKLPNIIDAMDGVHIPIHEPSENSARYVNRKTFHFINLLGVVPGGSYIIADAAYPLRTYLMKAFPNYYMLTARECHFNKVLSLMRMVVEQAFGHLKERWLKEIYCTNIEQIVKIIHACCILHNICIDMGDLLSSENVNKEMDDDINGNNEYEAENEEMEEMVSTQKREYLADLIIN
ncbi:9674_t:CDS:2 [Rhizophagus irregularis]|nr:9674_t:CDS:2 [Rhizophagus irregularis]